MSSRLALFIGTCISLGTSITVNTKLGEIEGVSTSDSVHQFLNIPYAEPPVNDLRWRPPKSLVSTPWEGIYDATTSGNACTQPPGMLDENEYQFSEDCLYLNIFTPYDFDDRENGIERLPVMFWIHGGGLLMGSAVEYNGTSLAAAENIVVVTINYRLGRAAFFADPALKGSSTGNGAANGFLDMIEALKWVQHNIESFGGDPNQVTIVGESGGAWAICGLVLSPLGRGLFRRSVQMSGSCIKSAARWRSTEEAEEAADYLFDILNVSSVDELRSIDMETIVMVNYEDSEKPIGDAHPAVDGYVFPMDTLKLIENGYINGDSVMIGTMFRDSFTAEPRNMGWVPKDTEDLIQFWRSFFDDSQVNMIQETYPVDEEGIKQKVWPYPSIFDDDRHAQLVNSQLQTDCVFRCGSIAQTELITGHQLTRNVPVYFYQFGYIEQPWDQVTHADDVSFLFAEDMSDQSTRAHEDFTKITQNFFGAYIRGEGAVIDDIEPTVNNGKYIQIVDEVKAVDLSELDLIKKRCDLMFELGNDAFDNSAFCWGFHSIMLDDNTAVIDPEEEKRSGFDEMKNAVCDWLCSD